MARYGLSAKISPTMRLEVITITLSDYAPPVVKLQGRAATGQRRVDFASSVTIETGWVGEKGRAFIDEMKDAFGGQVGAANKAEANQ